jgi:hypothetical protein
MKYHVNRQIGDYVIYSREANVAPFFVRMAGDESPLSTHWSVTEAVRQIKVYQAADARRRS